MLHFMSSMYIPTVKETPNDADIVSHQLMLRSGMIRKTTSGIYTFLPLGFRVIQKIENIIREEMDKIGAQEMRMPVLQPAEIWHESGRWGDYGPELMRLKDRHDREMCLGPTHEELITTLIRNELSSYKQLPCTMYQMQVKFRDEIRPRFGLLRSREFIMKDGYSFNESQESLQKTYDDMGRAYEKICDRCGLTWRGVEADSGQIGGKVTREYMALADSGEAEIVHCDCGYAANTEAGECICEATLHDVGTEKISTPGIHTIAELSQFLNIPENACAKALSCKDEEGKIYVLFVPGDHEVNEIKASKVVSGFEILSDEEMEKIGLPKGSMGPVGLPDGISVIADNSLKTIDKWVVGANEDGFHIVGAKKGVDFNVDEYADICTVKTGDKCPTCGKQLQGARGIEVSQIFQLGTKYSESLNATYLDENGKSRPFIMGCYGIGVSRTMAAVIEQHFDENGIIWPVSLAPYHIEIIELGSEDSVKSASECLQKACKEAGFDVLIDDRGERPGVKFADADLIGLPLQIVIGKRGLESNSVEIKLRSENIKGNVDFEKVRVFLEETASKVHELEDRDVNIFESVKDYFI